MIVLALGPIAVIARLTRGSMVEVLRSNFIRTARAKGLPTWRIITHHALRAGLLPLVSYLGPAIADIVSGSLIVEQIFGPSRHRALFRAGRAQPRLHAGAGGHHFLRRVDHRFEPCRGSPLRRARSAREV